MASVGDLSGKVAIITGPDQGTGVGIAGVFATHGAHGLIASSSAANDQQTAKAISEVGDNALLTSAMYGLGDGESLKAVARCSPAGDSGLPEDSACSMLYLASERAGYVTGQAILVDGGSTLPESQIVMEEFYDQ